MQVSAETELKMCCEVDLWCNKDTKRSQTKASRRVAAGLSAI